MSRIVWLTDLHVSSSSPVFGIDTKKRAAAAVAYIEEHLSDVEGCIISGDLVNRGTQADYQDLAEVLGHLSMPFYPMVGNHDKRELVKKHLPLPSSVMANFVQYAIDLKNCSIVCLDSQETGKDHGSFCSERADWLAGHLQKNPQTATIVFLHHPPLTLGLPMQDRDCLQDDGRLMSLLCQAKQVMYLCCGHVHRPVSGVSQGIPFSTLRSALYQAPAPVPPWNWDNFAPAEEAPQLAVIEVCEGDVKIQFHDFCKPHSHKDQSGEGPLHDHC